jgi:molybdate transport system substrate-binding protein
MRTRLLILVAALFLLASCGGDDETSSDSSDDLVVSAATSLKTAFEDIGGAKFSFAGSDDLAAQIRQGVKPDVFAAANTKLPDELFQDGLVEQPQVFAGNRLVLAVPADGAKVTELTDLYGDDVSIAMGDEEVPVGAYTREVLGKLGPESEQDVLDNVKSFEPDVGGIVGKLTQGAVDAGFVYITDVEATKGELKAIELPEDISPVVSYGVAVVKGAKHPEEAQAFVDSLLDGAGKDALLAAGFTTP